MRADFTKEEFQARVLEIQKVKKIFVDTGLVENISKAFQAYQEVLEGADIYNHRRSNLRSSKRSIGKKGTIELPFTPMCPKCKNKLQMRRLCPKGNLYGYRAHWYCTTGDCIWEIYSKDLVPKELTHVRSKNSR